MPADTPNRPAFTARARKIGVASAAAILGASLVYGVVLVAGLRALPTADEPIGDPWFAIMELLILVIAPAMVALIASVRAWSPISREGLGFLTIAPITVAALVTCGVHLVLLAATPRADANLAFRWPSVPYALDILAWDILFAVAVLCAAPLLRGAALSRWAGRLFTASGVLALAGLAGIPLGDMQVRNIGIVGYAVVFPVAAGLLLVLFLRTPAER